MKTLAFALALGVAAPLSVAVVQPAQAQAASAEDARITAFFDREFEQELALNPMFATQLGRKAYKDRLDDLSEAGQLKALQWRRASVARMKAQFDRKKLSPPLQASYDMWAEELERAELSYRFRRYEPPLGSWLRSVHSQLPNFLVNIHTVDDAADMRAYIARVRALGPALDQAVERTRAAAADGVRTPRFGYERVITSSGQFIAGEPFDTSGKDAPLWADAKAKIAKLQSAGKVTPAEAQGLLADARSAMLTLRAPYQRVIAWAESDIANAPTTRVGSSTLPNGAAWYAAALRLMTTTDMTAEQVHQLGLAEVARIEREQDALARSAGFADRQAFFADRARRFPPTPWTDELRGDYLARANGVVRDVRAKLPGWFGVLPAYRMEVIRQSPFSEVPGGAAQASFPSADGSRPGYVYVHLAGVTDDPAKVTNLMCHEAVPGHVMQGDIQARQKGLPKFRSAYLYTAYAEGWGLYAEQVCKEMGAYSDAASDMMRLNGELFRAARLVVDSGIHAKGWSEAQAVDYMINSGRAGADQARSEVRRYITMPGQATAYKIGMIRIQQARSRAERALGPKFDIKAFHDLVVGLGSVPLPVLDRAVDDWIASRKAG